jgi:hypothetical protein
MEVIQNVEGETSFGIGNTSWEETLPAELNVLLDRPRASTELDMVLKNARTVDDGHCGLLNDVFLQWVSRASVQIHFIFPFNDLVLRAGAGLSSMANIQREPFLKQ